MAPGFVAEKVEVDKVDVSRFSSSGLDSTLKASFFGCKKKTHFQHLMLDYPFPDGPTFPDNLQGEGERVELLKLFARSDIGLISIPIVPPSCKADLLTFQYQRHHL